MNDSSTVPEHERRGKTAGTVALPFILARSVLWWKMQKERNFVENIGPQTPLLAGLGWFPWIKGDHWSGMQEIRGQCNVEEHKKYRQQWQVALFFNLIFLNVHCKTLLRGTEDYRLDFGPELDSWTFTHTGTLERVEYSDTRHFSIWVEYMTSVPLQVGIYNGLTLKAGTKYPKHKGWPNNSLGRRRSNHSAIHYAEDSFRQVHALFRGRVKKKLTLWTKTIKQVQIQQVWYIPCDEIPSVKIDIGQLGRYKKCSVCKWKILY